MKIYDISQELMGCVVYPGDKAPEKEIVSDMECGDLYNLTNISICAHNGTHMDAPLHFIKGGLGIDGIPLENVVGDCLVWQFEGELTARDVLALADEKKEKFPKRILIKGNATVTAEAAKIFAEKEIYLLGNESQTVGPENAPMEVHKILLEKNVVLLEGIRLSEVDEGEYFLCAAPINIAGGDGAPCRAILIERT